MALYFWMTAAFAFSSDGNDLLYAVIGAGIGVFLFIKGFKEFQLKRLIQNTPNCKVRSAAIGLVEMQGISVGPYTIVSPVQQKQCFFYRTQLWRWQEAGKESEWVQVCDERRHVPFYLKDNTGMVLVDPNNAEFDIHRDYHEEFHSSMFSSTTPGPGALSFIERHGLTSGAKVKLEEYTIRPENPIFILGTLATNHGLLRPCCDALITGASGVKLRGVSLDFSSGFGFLSSLGMARLAGMGGAGSSPLTVNVSRQFTTVHVDKDGKTTTVSSSTPPAPTGETLRPGDPRAAAAVATIAAKDPELAQKLATHLNVPYPPPANAPATAQQPAGTVDVSVHTYGQPGAAAAIVAGIAARDPVLASVVGRHLGVNLGAPPAAHNEPAAPAAGDWPDHDPTVIQKGTHDTHYYISWRSQKEVLSSLAWHSFLSIWGGPILTLACVWYLLNKFGM